MAKKWSPIAMVTARFSQRGGPSEPVFGIAIALSPGWAAIARRPRSTLTSSEQKPQTESFSGQRQVNQRKLRRICHRCRGRMILDPVVVRLPRDILEVMRHADRPAVLD